MPPFLLFTRRSGDSTKLDVAALLIPAMEIQVLLKRIIRPFYKLMNRLEYASKFGVIMLMFAVPLFVLLFQLYSAFNNELKQARLHSEGLAAMLQSHALIRELEQWRDTAALKFVSTAPDIDRLHQNSLEEVKHTLASVKQFLLQRDKTENTSFLNTLTEQLNTPAIAAGMEGITIELVFDNVHRYVEDAYDWQRQLATSYGLLGISDDQTFRAINIFLYDASDSYEAFGRARVFGSFFLFTGFIDSSGTYVIDKTYATLEKEAENIRSKLDSLFALDASNTQRSEFFLIPLYGVLDLMDEQLIQVMSLEAAWQDYFSSTGELRNAARELEEGALHQTHGKIKLSQQAHERERLLLMGFTLTLTLLTILLYMGFYYSVNRTIARLVSAARAVAEGDLDRDMQTRTNDELSALGLALNNMREQLKARQEALHHASITDGLTELYNRAYFDRTLQAETNRAIRGKYPLTVLLLDIDHFKKVNDTYGHAAGDACIRFVADCLKDCAKRDSDTAARYGGEEFAVILPNSSLEDGFEIAEQARKSIEQKTIQHEGSTIRITISCGLTSRVPQSIQEAEDMLRIADEALYTAKRSGRNCVMPEPEPTHSANG